MAGCLTSVLAAADAAPGILAVRVIVDVIVTLDGCRDATAAVVAGFRRVVPTASTRSRRRCPGNRCGCGAAACRRIH